MILARVAGRPEQHAVNFAVLRSMQKAEYSPMEEGHYALASDCYCHFTSPIRRYPDLTVHRLLDAVVLGKPPVSDFDALVTEGEHCSDCEERAEKAERELIKIKRYAVCPILSPNGRSTVTAMMWLPACCALRRRMPFSGFPRRLRASGSSIPWSRALRSTSPSGRRSAPGSWPDGWRSRGCSGPGRSGTCRPTSSKSSGIATSR